MEVRIATFNIFWFLSSSFIGNRRSSDDQEKIREVIRRLDADVLVFQEILDLQALEELLSDVVPCARSSLGREEGSCNRQNLKPFVVDPVGPNPTR